MLQNHSISKRLPLARCRRCSSWLEGYWLEGYCLVLDRRVYYGCQRLESCSLSSGCLAYCPELLPLSRHLPPPPSGQLPVLLRLARGMLQVCEGISVGPVEGYSKKAPSCLLPALLQLTRGTWPCFGCCSGDPNAHSVRRSPNALGACLPVEGCCSLSFLEARSASYVQKSPLRYWERSLTLFAPW